MAEQKVPIMLSVPISMKLALEEAAKEQKLPTASYARTLVADGIGYKLPADIGGRARKYESAEAREAARKEREAERKATVNAILKAIREGKLNLKDYLESAGVGEAVTA
jgi:hypothetical protein